MEWISVKDKLPSNAGLYLVICDWMGVVEKGEFDGRSEWFIHNHSFVPTHWMPLPDTPEDQRKRKFLEICEEVLKINFGEFEAQALIEMIKERTKKKDG